MLLSSTLKTLLIHLYIIIKAYSYTPVLWAGGGDKRGALKLTISIRLFSKTVLENYLRENIFSWIKADLAGSCTCSYTSYTTFTCLHLMSYQCIYWLSSVLKGTSYTFTLCLSLTDKSYEKTSGLLAYVLTV